MPSFEKTCFLSLDCTARLSSLPLLCYLTNTVDCVYFLFLASALHLVSRIILYVQESYAVLLSLQDATCTCFDMSFPGGDHLPDEAPDDLEEEMMQQAIAMSLQVSSPTQQYVLSFLA